jgi:tRNA-dihydrouridine synthase B
VRSARKHLGWYAQSFAHPADTGAQAFRQRINTATTCDTQLAAVTDFFDEWEALGDAPACPDALTEPLKLAA